MIEPILSKVANGNTGLFDTPAGSLSFLGERLPGISDIAGKSITILDVAEIFVGKRSGVDTTRKMLEVYHSVIRLKTIFSTDGVLLASHCEFRPESGRNCVGGVTEFLEDDGTRRLVEMSRNLKETFSDPEYDAFGNPISPAHRWLIDNCPLFEIDVEDLDVEPNCGNENSCNGCDDPTETAKCKARQVTWQITHSYYNMQKMSN